MAIDRSAPKDFGSGLCWYKEVNSDGTDLATPDTWHKFPRIKDSELAWDFSGSSAKTETDEGGETFQISITAGGTKASFKGNAFTGDHSSMNTFFVVNRSKYYALVKEINQTKNADGNYEYAFMPVASLSGGVSMKNGTTFPFEFTLNTVSSTTTLSHTGLVASLTGVHATTIGADITVSANTAVGFGTGT